MSPVSIVLGEFEQLILLALVRLGPDAYGATVRREIEEHAGREVSISAVYTTLERLRPFLIGQDHLNRHVVAEQDAAGQVDRPHPAFRQRREDFVASVEDLTNREHVVILTAFRLKAEATREFSLLPSPFSLESLYRKIRPIRFPRPERKPSIARRTRCLMLPEWIGHRRPGIWSPSLKYSVYTGQPSTGLR